MDTTIRTTVIIGSLLTIGVAYATPSVNDLCIRAQDAYEKKEWLKALGLYENVEMKGSPVWYNMGNCCYKMGNPSQAIIYWKRAMSGASADEQGDIMHNLGVAYEKLGQKKDRSFYTIVERWAYRFPLLPLQLIFLFCWYALWVLFLMGTAKHPFLFYTALFSLTILLILMSIILGSSYYRHSYKKGVVVKESVSLFAGPHEQYHPVGTVTLHDELRIHEQRTGWYKVARADQYGWIASIAVELI